MPESTQPPSPDTQSTDAAAPTEGEATTPRGLLDYLTDPTARRIEWLAFGLVAALLTFALLLTRGDLLAQAVPVGEDVDSEAATEASAPAVTRDLPVLPYRLAELELHPDHRFGHYFSGAFFSDPDRSTTAGSRISALEDWRTQLEVYRKRAGEDDNFTIRVYDNRNWRTLEVYALREQRERYEASGEANWDRIDALRRAAHNQLISKWVARGVPRDNVALRWGRLNQIQESRERETAYLEHVIRYARQLGLSLLSTQISTVETFNQDWMVSPAGARGRYQMMPDNLDLFELRTYNLAASSGTVAVREELHPLLSLLASFQLVRGYSNAVGHEIPGVSGYHTGPGNIFVVYQNFLRAHAGNASVHQSSVIDAYMWGVTSGFDRVWQQSSFGPASRGYVLAAYGALRALEDSPVDPELTLHTERVQLAAGAQIQLDELLELLLPHGARVNWGAGVDHGNLYERFRRLNAHMALPASGSPDELSVPAAGNVRLTATAGGNAVRFFLPHGATELLERIRPGLLNPARTFQFDDDAFANPAVTGEKSQADYAYDELIIDIANFGFTNSNRNRLERIYRQFVQLAEENPSQYRVAQLKIITIHRRVWQTRRFNELAGTVENVLGARQTASR